MSARKQEQRRRDQTRPRPARAGVIDPWFPATTGTIASVGGWRSWAVWPALGPIRPRLAGSGTCLQKNERCRCPDRRHAACCCAGVTQAGCPQPGRNSSAVATQLRSTRGLLAGFVAAYTITPRRSSRRDLSRSGVSRRGDVSPRPSAWLGFPTGTKNFRSRGAASSHLRDRER
jgi:hypothetical protein